MQTHRNHRTIDKPGAVILSLFFVCVIYFNFFLTLMNYEFLVNFSENRRLAQSSHILDNIISKNIKGTCEKFERYLNDHFALRKPLVMMSNSTRYYVFNSSTDRVALPARDGWIFYGTVSMIRDHERKDRLSAEHLNQIKRSLIQKEAWLSSFGITFLNVIVPNKHNIYPQFMPEAVHRGDGPSRGEYLVHQLNEDLPKSTVDAFHILREFANHEQVYYKIDTHWNHLGASIVTAHIIEILSTSNSRFRTLRLPAMKHETVIFSPGNFGRVMGVPLQEEEVIPLPRTGWGWHVAPADHIKAFLPPRARVLKRVNPNAFPATVLVLGDSYMARFGDYLSEAFRDTILVNLWDTPLAAASRFPISLIEHVQPDLVIQMFAERRIGFHGQRNQGYYYCVENPPGMGLTSAEVSRADSFH